MKQTETVKMQRTEPVYPGGPVRADVAPADVDEWQRAGWHSSTSAKEPAPVAAPVIAPQPPADTIEVATPRRGRRPLNR